MTNDEKVSAFRIEPCSVDDGPAIAATYIAAMWTDSTWRLMWRPKTREYVASQAVLRMPFQLLKDPARRRHQKAVHRETGEVVGYARWLLPSNVASGSCDVAWSDAKVPRVRAEREAELEKDFASADYDYDHAWDSIDEAFMQRKEELMGEKQYMLLDVLAVHPEHRRQGVASALVRSGLAEAQSMRRDVFVHALKPAVGVYRGAGFVLRDAIVEDDSAIGGTGECGAYFLEWQAS